MTDAGETEGVHPRSAAPSGTEGAGAGDPEALADYALAALHGLTGAAQDGLGAERLAEIAEGFAAGIPHS